MLSSLIGMLSEHPNKDALPEEARGLLAYLEGLPEIDCEGVPEDAQTVVKGWMIESALVTAMIGRHYDMVGAEA